MDREGMVSPDWQAATRGKNVVGLLFSPVNVYRASERSVEIGVKRSGQPA